MDGPPSVDALHLSAAENVPAIVLHGSGDLIVPLAAPIDASNRLNAQLITTDGLHSWMITDPTTLRAAIEEIRLELEWAIIQALFRTGGHPTTIMDLVAGAERRFYDPDSFLQRVRVIPRQHEEHRQPKFTISRHHHSAA